MRRGSTLAELIEGLSRPAAYDHSVDSVQVEQTHISVVFLADAFVYKIKKPVDLGFLDFTSLELRERFCREEVRLNRRLAPDVYLGVRPIVERGGQLVVAGPDETVLKTDVLEWAVVMRRLPSDATMASWIADGALGPYHVAVVGRRLAQFHAGASRGPAIAEWGRFEVVDRNARENLEQARGHIGHTLTPELHGRLEAALERELRRVRRRVEARAETETPCDTHGDLHLDHVYLFGDRDPPDDIVIIDCIEFNERFRFADPVADVAFLDMDLRYHFRDDLARTLSDAYFDASGDEDGRELLTFYSAYRAAVRAKVLGMRALEPEVEPENRAQAAAEARAHWTLGLGLLEAPPDRPCLMLVGGLPGTGKSTLSRALSARAGFAVVSSDPTRKRLAGIEPGVSAAAAYGQGIYTSEWNERTYAALLEEAERRLLRGERVIVDASFREDGRRREFLECARRLRIPGLFFHLESPAGRVLARIEAREGGASDADRATYEAVAQRWEQNSDMVDKWTRVIDTSQTVGWSVEQAMSHMTELGVVA